jgi:hypothetical protein
MLSGKSKSGNPCLAWFLSEISIRDSKRSLGRRFGHLMKSLTFRNTQKGLGLDSSRFSLPGSPIFSLCIILPGRELGVRPGSLNRPRPIFEIAKILYEVRAARKKT